MHTLLQIFPKAQMRLRLRLTWLSVVKSCQGLYGAIQLLLEKEVPTWE